MLYFFTDKKPLKDDPLLELDEYFQNYVVFSLGSISVGFYAKSLTVSEI